MTEEEAEGAADQVFPLAKQLSDALLGAVFPLSREQLVYVARENDTPRSLLTVLSSLPAVDYKSLDQVVEASNGVMAAEAGPAR